MVRVDYPCTMYCLYVDLDGVLVDFDAGVISVAGSRPEDLSPRQMWPKLARSPGFYENLDWLEGGRELWEYVKDKHPTILTGLPLGKWAEPQKRRWCERELGPRIPVETCMSRRKAERAGELTPEGAVPVLVDDRVRLRDRWLERGGIFIHYTGTGQAIGELESLAGEFVPSLR